MVDPNSFYGILARAIADIVEFGFDSEGRIAFWTVELKKAALRLLLPEYRLQEMLNGALGAIYRRLVERGGIARYHKDVAAYTIEKLNPLMRQQLDRHIMASAQLIKLNREETIATTLRRFSGWATSVPAGGANDADKRTLKREQAKALRQLPFNERRVIIDQGHKLVSSINSVVATNGGAIAMVWHSHWRQANYNFRPDHKERDGHAYLIKGSWASEAGFVKPGPDGWSDSITQPAEEPFCRCYATYVYTLGGMPSDMLTAKGREELARVKARAAAA